jgi:hypothetical protein
MNAPRDDNDIPVLLGQDATTGEAVPLLVDEEGRLLTMLVYSEFEPEPNQEIAIDDNYNYVGLAVTDEEEGETIEAGESMGLLLSLTYPEETVVEEAAAGGTIYPLIADPTTGYLLVDVSKTDEEIITGSPMGLLLSLTYS